MMTHILVALGPRRRPGSGADIHHRQHLVSDGRRSVARSLEAAENYLALQWWAADDTFLDLVRDQASINSFLGRWPETSGSKASCRAT
jgi:hypothetical protein